MVGQSSIINYGPPTTHAWAAKFNSDGTWTNLGDLGGGGYIGSNGPNVISGDAATGINDYGVIVGESYTTASTYHAFIYGLGGNNTMQDMNTVFGSGGYNVIPTGWSLYCAYSIDNNGDIAGLATERQGSF